MADTVDRVFVQALNTVKKVPSTGAARPPEPDLMRLYGLYKQAMEGDVAGVLERPNESSRKDVYDMTEWQREQDKWDAWDAQRGLSRTQAKRGYIEALIDIMHRYATTPQSVELAAELEFVWNQIKDNSPSSSPKSSSAPGLVPSQPMQVLSPMSEDEDIEYRLAARGEELGLDGRVDGLGRDDRRSRNMERAIIRLSLEITALREQLAAGRKWRSARRKSVSAWLRWLFMMAFRHLAVDAVFLVTLLLWMRRRRDKRLEDQVRAMLALGKEYMRSLLPAR